MFNNQSEGRESNREFVNLIHQGELEFPDKKPKGRPIEITYKYDTSGVCIVLLKMLVQIKNMKFL